MVTAAAATTDRAPRAASTWPWLLPIALALWASPSLYALATQVWTSDQGALGPIMLATALWLLKDSVDRAGPTRPGALWIVVGSLAVLTLGQFVGRLADVLIVQLLCVYAAVVVLLYARGGFGLCQRLALPLIYLLLVIPVPSGLMAQATRGLKLWVAGAATDLTGLMGFEVARTGAQLFIDQYELLVEAACSGMNSLVSLVALGCLYAYLSHRESPLRALSLAVLAIPIAIFANLVRIVALLLLVHFQGVDILETPVHLVTGFATFALAMLLLFVIDLAWPRKASR